MNFSFETILPFILALLLIFIIPMLAARRGLSYGEFVKSLFTETPSKLLPNRKKAALKQTVEPILSNGRKNELTELVSTLLIFVRKNELSMVYPGTVVRGEELSSVLCFVVTRAHVYGVNCFGYSGTISEAKGGVWKQRINGKDVSIPSAQKLTKSQFDLVREVMDNSGMADIPLTLCSVFTNENARLALQDSTGVYNRDNFIQMLKEAVAKEQPAFDPQQTANALKKLTTVVKPGRKKS